MAEAIPDYPSFVGTDFSIYKITLTTDGSGYSYECTLTNGTSALEWQVLEEELIRGNGVGRDRPVFLWWR